MVEQYIYFAIYAGIALGIGIFVIAAGSFLGRVRVSSRHKYDSYECGMDQMDSPHKSFSIKFYVVALVFMLFDVETIFFLPWAQGFVNYGVGALEAMAFFVVILGFGLWYVLKTGVLEWD